MTARERKKAREEFFKQHPVCCFCGGQTPATTQDHFPGRALFANRQWPEGYVFPACQACNAESSDDELVMAILTRLGPNSDNKEQRSVEAVKALNALERQNPELRKGFKLFPRNEERKRLLDLGSPTFDKKGDPVKLAQVPDEAFTRAENFAKKLVKALHYFHTGKIIPSTGHVTATAYLNAELPALNHEALTEVLGGRPDVIRNAQPLKNQFDYKYGVVEDNLASGYWISFGAGTISFVASAHSSKDKYQQEMRRETQQMTIQEESSNT